MAFRLKSGEMLFSPVDCLLSLVDGKPQWRALSLMTGPVSSLPVGAAFLWHGLGCPGQAGGEECQGLRVWGTSAGPFPVPALRKAVLTAGRVQPFLCLCLAGHKQNLLSSEWFVNLLEMFCFNIHKFLLK